MSVFLHHYTGCSFGCEVGETCDIFKDEGVGFPGIAESLGEDLVTLHAPDTVFDHDTAG